MDIVTTTRPRGSTHRHGTTLIELMVVVAVISVLVASALPGLGKARRMAGRVACQANLKQLATTWASYTEDNNDRYFQLRGATRAQLAYGGWKGFWGWSPRPLNPYVGLPAQVKNDLGEATVSEQSAKLFRCPSDRGGPTVFLGSAYEEFGTSYITNAWLVGNGTIPIRPGYCPDLHTAMQPRLAKLKQGQVDEPSRLILMGDYGWWNQREITRTQRTEWHGRACYHNLAFVDGHVEFLRVRKGLYYTSTYRVLPFSDLDSLASACQLEISCEVSDTP